MPTNATAAAIIAALAPVLAAIVVLFKLNLTQDQQGELVAGLAAIVTAGAVIYGSVVHVATAKVAVARAYQAGLPAPDQGDAQSIAATIEAEAKK